MNLSCKYGFALNSQECYDYYKTSNDIYNLIEEIVYEIPSITECGVDYLKLIKEWF